jgi:hypothetical protein
MKLDSVPVVDYGKHPAFAAEAARFRPDAETDALISEIEADYDILNKNSDAAELKAARFEQEIVPKLERLNDRLAASARPEFAGFLGKAMLNAQSFLRNELTARDHLALERNRPGALPEELHNRLSGFRERGCSEFHKPDLARKAWAATWAERRLLLLRAKMKPNAHCVMPLHIASPAFRMVKQMAEESGLIDFVSAYTGKEMEFWYVALDHAHPGQDWYKGCYADIGLPTAKTVYMHYDADFDLIKALFYLKDVGPGDGPFRFIPGSHKWARSNLTLAVQNGFDKASGEVFARETRNRGYYRPRFMLADRRADIVAMPQFLRGSTHFGDDVEDGSQLSKMLLEAEHSFVSPAGTFVLFDGSRGIHRGGQVEPGGVRWAMQVGFRLRKAEPQVRGPKQRLKDQASYVKSLIWEYFRIKTGK